MVSIVLQELAFMLSTALQSVQWFTSVWAVFFLLFSFTSCLFQTPVTIPLCHSVRCACNIEFGRLLSNIHNIPIANHKYGKRKPANNHSSSSRGQYQSILLCNTQSGYFLFSFELKEVNRLRCEFFLYLWNAAAYKDCRLLLFHFFL